MLAYVIRRVPIGIVVLLVASFFVFVLVAESGNPLATMQANPEISEATIRAAARQLHLNDPLLQRYWYWFSHFVRGDFGQSYSGQPVAPELGQSLLTTLKMVVPVTILSAVLAVVAGVVGAVRQYSVVDNISTGLAYLFYSTPVFVVAILLKDFVAVPVNNATGHTILYTIGQSSVGSTGGFWSTVADQVAHGILPVLSLVLITYAAWSRYQRAAMLDVLNSDYLRLARSKGLRPGRVLVRHGLRNALIPLTTIVSLDFAVVIGGAVVTETVFGWHGMGRLLLDGLTGPVSPDVNVVQAWLMVVASVIVAFNIIADVLYAVLDPRVRYA